MYRCGSQEGWSRRFQFRALRNGTAWSPRVAVYGDMGLENPRALPRLQREARAGLYDAVLHVGAFRSAAPTPELAASWAWLDVGGIRGTGLGGGGWPQGSLWAVLYLAAAPQSWLHCPGPIQA